MAEEKKDTTINNDRLPVEIRAQMLSNESGIFLNMAKFEHAQRVAGMLMAAKMWPDHIRTVGDALIVMNMADRMQADPFMLAQRIYIVHGKPGLEGKLVISLINNSGKYSDPLRFEFSGARDADPSDTYDQDQDTKQIDAYGCRAITVDKRSGKTVRGPKITWKIVKAEGWLGKQGSKWKTMAELMFQYRSASWFANINCPEVTLGLPTADELRDVVELHQDMNGKYQAVETERKPVTFNDDPPLADTPKRARRTKAEIEAERLAHANYEKEQAEGTAGEVVEQFPQKGQQSTQEGHNPTIGKGLENTDEWGNLNDLIKANRTAYMQAKIDMAMPQGPRDLIGVNAIIARLQGKDSPAREPGQDG